MKTRVLLIALASALVLTGLAWARAFYWHPLRAGQLLEAQAFEDGTALTLQYAGQDTLYLTYYSIDGEELALQTLPLAGKPDTLILQVCGQYAQLFISYPAQIENDPTTVAGERFVWKLPVSQGCFARVFLPLVLEGVP